MENQVAMNEAIAKTVAEATRSKFKQSQKYKVKVKEQKANEDPS